MTKKKRICFKGDFLTLLTFLKEYNMKIAFFEGEAALTYGRHYLKIRYPFLLLSTRDSMHNQLRIQAPVFHG